MGVCGYCYYNNRILWKWLFCWCSYSGAIFGAIIVAAERDEFVEEVNFTAIVAVVVVRDSDKEKEYFGSGVIPHT